MFIHGSRWDHRQWTPQLDSLTDDFEEEYEFESSMDRPMPVTVKAPADGQSQRVLTRNTADSQEIYGLLQWILIDIFPEHSTKLGQPKKKSE